MNAPRSAPPDAIAAAFARVPRARFLPPGTGEDGAIEGPVPLGRPGASLSAVDMVETMLRWLAARPGDRVLEVGSGSGYVLALLAELVGPEGEVHGVEIDGELAAHSRRTLDLHGWREPRVRIHHADGAAGDPRHGPFDRILLSCASKEVLASWREQLSSSGRGVGPIGSPDAAVLTAWTADPHRPLERGPLCAFVPLRRPGPADI